jgi:hypothetical protein
MYGHVPPKLVITAPWKALCVDQVDPYTLNGKDGSSIDFMCLTMINPATSWFEIVELPTVRVMVPYGGKGKKTTCLDYTKDEMILTRHLPKSVTYCTNAGSVDTLVVIK